MGLQLGSSLGTPINMWGGATGQINPRLLAATAAHPTPAPAAPRGPSSLEAQRFLPVRVDTSEVLHLEHKDEPHERDGRKDDHATARHCCDVHDYTESLPLHLRV